MSETTLVIYADSHWDPDKINGFSETEIMTSRAEEMVFYNPSAAFNIGDIHGNAFANDAQMHTRVDQVHAGFATLRAQCPIYHVVGNHDDLGLSGDNRYEDAEIWCAYDSWCPAINFTVDLANGWRVIAFENFLGDWYNSHANTVSWITTQLQDAEADGNVDYVILMTHIPSDTDYPGSAIPTGDNFTESFYRGQGVIGDNEVQIASGLISLSNDVTSGTITITASDDIFTDPTYIYDNLGYGPGWLGRPVFLKHGSNWGLVEITGVTDAKTATAIASTIYPPTSTGITTDWGFGRQGRIAWDDAVLRDLIAAESTKVKLVVTGHDHPRNVRKTVSGIDYIILRAFWAGPTVPNTQHGSFSVLTLSDDGTYVLQGAKSQRTYNTDIRYVNSVRGLSTNKGGLIEYPISSLLNALSELEDPENDNIRHFYISAGSYDARTYDSADNGDVGDPVQFIFDLGCSIDCGGSGSGITLDGVSNVEFLGNKTLITGCNNGLFLKNILINILVDSFVFSENAFDILDDSLLASSNVIVQRFDTNGASSQSLRTQNSSVSNYKFGKISEASTHGINIADTSNPNMNNISVYGCERNIFLNGGSTTILTNIISAGGIVNDIIGGGGSRGTISHSFIISPGNFSGITQDNVTIGINPQFVDPDNNDFNLKLTSPCIKTADASVIIAGDLDLNGNTVSITQPDIGAFQLKPGPFPFIIGGDSWTPISLANQSGTCWVQKNPGKGQVIISHSDSGEGILDVDVSYFMPSNKRKIVDISADNINDVFYARCSVAGESAIIDVDVL